MFVCVKRKTRTRLYLLSILRSGEKMSKRLGGIIGCKYKNKTRTRLYLLSIPQSGGKKVKTFRWERRLLLCYCKRKSASESEGITLDGAREVQKYSLSVWPFKARSLII